MLFTHGSRLLTRDLTKFNENTLPAGRFTGVIKINFSTVEFDGQLVEAHRREYNCCEVSPVDRRQIVVYVNVVFVNAFCCDENMETPLLRIRVRSEFKIAWITNNYATKTKI